MISFCILSDLLISPLFTSCLNTFSILLPPSILSPAGFSASSLIHVDFRLFIVGFQADLATFLISVSCDFKGVSRMIDSRLLDLGTAVLRI